MILCKKIPGEKIPAQKIISLIAYNAGKNLTPLYIREKILIQTKSLIPQLKKLKSQMVGLKKNVFEIVGLYILLLDFS